MRALITGITGQDGSYLTELLLEKGAEVNAKQRDTGTTVLWVALWKGHTEIVKLLLRSGGRR